MGRAGNCPNFAGAAGQLVAGTIQENLFILGQSFSYEDWLTYGAAATNTFIFDPTACTCDQIIFQPFAFSAQSGPVEIEVFVGAAYTAGSGTPLGVSNRRATSTITPEGLLILNPTVTSPGVEFAGDLVPSTGTAPANSSGSENTQGLPFELDTSFIYKLTVKNTDGAGIRIQFKTTWFEVRL